jgi:hypothetical protein
MLPEERLDRIEIILEQMAARQQYHDEALERHDEQIRDLIAAVAADGENIRALARIAEAHQRRIKHLEDDQAE